MKFSILFFFSLVGSWGRMWDMKFIHRFIHSVSRKNQTSGRSHFISWNKYLVPMECDIFLLDGYGFGRWPRMRAGKNNTALRKANSASKVIPINRKGSEINHTMGHINSASMASGQHKTNRMHHKIKIKNDFIFLSLIFLYDNKNCERYG